MTTRLPLGLLCALGGMQCAHGQSDESALLLADQALTQTAVPRDWRAFVEAGLTAARSSDGSTQWGERLSFDGHADGHLGVARYVISDRLDLNEYEHPDGHDDINTLKEAYLSWQLTPAAMVDVGRINLRYGAAFGYNPTDVFRANAVRSVVSLDPSSLRENRQGSVVAQVQALSDNGSLTAVFSPRLTGAQSEATWSPDWGATNASSRWLLAAGEKVSDRFAPQLLVFGDQHHDPQLGMNLSGLLGNATTVYAEWTGGKAASLFGQLYPAGAPAAFQERAALGATYSTESKVSVTLEYELNTAGLDRAGLDALFRNRGSSAGNYLQYCSGLQDLPTKRALFVDVTRTDAGIQHLDVSAFLRFDPVSRSRIVYSESRYHFDHADIALQLTASSGAERSIPTSVAAARIATVLFRYFL